MAPTLSSLQSTAIPTVKNQEQKRYSCSQYVRTHTEMLVIGINRTHALQKLYDIKCPMSVYEACETEQVIEKYCSRLYECQYLIELLSKKFEDLRRKEAREAEEKRAKHGYLEGKILFTPMYIKMKEEEMANTEQQEINKLFTNAIKTTSVAKRAMVKPDYSKFKIKKRSSLSSTSPSSLTSTPSPPSGRRNGY
ncbi:hypothetical protein GCK72_006823 [Caenorhabditis remanei]|uniref:Uncharacterized protein n=1 Tax=Caenorhabditis remanei TaxID=31234 RepID=A0A6A5HHA5_CAERE|nr:hypothetical protein GCK72_006823 [Caenorhabditis remanei]KAF1766865.1 hypothetical protein GCK72_006823 [Caenorhabditis remanei]